MDAKLTNIQAFKAMRIFLEGYYHRTKSDDIASLLGDLQQFSDGSTFDPAAWEDWVESVEKALKA